MSCMQKNIFNDIMVQGVVSFRDSPFKSEIKGTEYFKYALFKR